EDMSDYWFMYERNYNENFRVYEYRTYEGAYFDAYLPEFIRSIEQAYNNHRHHHLTSLRLYVDMYDELEGEVRTNVSVRFELAYMNMETFFWYLEQIIADNIAPPWFHSGDHVFSDQALNK